MITITIRRKALKLLKAVNHNLSIDSLCGYAEYLGYKVMFFCPDGENPLIDKLDLEDRCLEKDGFIYSESNLNIIFINGSLKFRTLIMVLLHEIGHIVLEHSTSMESDEKQEIEAQMFTNYILTYTKPNLKVLLTPLSVACAVLICAIVFQNTNHKAATAYVPTETAQMPQAESIEIPNEEVSNAVSVAVTDEVYVTSSGRRYHRADCYYLHSSAIPLDIETAKMSYTPCKVCRP